MTGGTVQALKGWIIFALLATGWYFLFRYAFGLNYFRWYLDNGALIAIAFSFLTSIIPEISEDERLVSANPMTFFKRHSHYIGVMFLTLGANLRSAPTPAAAEARLIDKLMAMITILAVSLLSIGYLLVVCPIQYCLTVFFGALSRVAAAQRRETTMTEGSKTWTTTLAEKPVSLTNAFIALGLWIFNALTSAG